jgi:Ni,Fe-hydrogenase III small subunit/ferredoxin
VSLWVLRGLREGVVTTRWPRRPDSYAGSWRGPATVHEPHPAQTAGLGGLCPAGAISVSAGEDERHTVRLDQGRCILCGRCVAERPDVFAWSRGATGPSAAALTRGALVVPNVPETDENIEAARAALRRRTAALRRSLHIRHVDAGSDGAGEWEINALTGPIYDLHRTGLFFTASPRHADVLLVTGAGAKGMAGPLLHTYEAMPHPKVVIAAGTDAISGGLLGESDVTAGGVSAIVPVDVWLPGSPPSPFGILNALLMAAGKLAGGGKPEGAADANGAASPAGAGNAQGGTPGRLR